MSAVIGIGNEHRHDDGFGPAVVAYLRSLPERCRAGVRLVVSDGEPARLIEAWSGAHLVVLVDTVLVNTVPGDTVLGTPVGRWRELRDAEIAQWPATSSHRMSVAQTIALARALDRLPPAVIVLAAVGADFGHGVGLSPALAAAVAPVAARAAELAGCAVRSAPTPPGGHSHR